MCSGIEAASVAWEPLGWEASAFSEIEPFPSAVLNYRFPTVPNLGDMTRFKEWNLDQGSIDLLVGGTPCQSFSVAGLREGLRDPRGNLMLTYGAIAGHFRPTWIVWENVPGVLSSNGGRDFGTFLGMLGQLGYGFSYRVLDAQYFGVPQRRRRVFVVGHLGDWRRAASVLFESESMQGHSPPSRETGEEVAGTLGSRAQSGGGFGGDFECSGGLQVSPTISTRYGDRSGQDMAIDGALIAHSLRGEGFDASEDGTGRGTPLVPISFALRGIEGGAMPEAEGDKVGALKSASGGSSRSFVAFTSKDYGADTSEVAPTLRAMGHAKSHANGGGQLAVAFHNRQDPDVSGNVTHPLGAKDNGLGINVSAGVRRLTPRECERLQGFPDDWTLIPYNGKPSKDGPRYKAIGNSMAVPIMRWIGERIAKVDEKI